MLWGEMSRSLGQEYHPITCGVQSKIEAPESSRRAALALGQQGQCIFGGCHPGQCRWVPISWLGGERLAAREQDLALASGPDSFYFLA